MKNVVDISNLSIRRSQGFHLEIPKLAAREGDIICITGPNGSGKTTLLGCLSGLLTPDRGRVSINGAPITKNLRATKADIGFVPDDEDWLIKELCAKEYLELLARVYRDAGVKRDTLHRAHKLAERLYFTALSEPLAALSHGNKKKVQLIAALMHAPRLLIVDEMRNGLDPLAVIASEQLLKDEAKRGTCIIATTHDLWWAERTGVRILLLLNGSVKAYQKTSLICKKYGSVEGLFLQSVEVAQKS